LCTQIFAKTLRGDGVDWIPPRVYPLVLFVCFAIAVVFPWRQRRSLWTTIGSVLLSPLTPVTFRGTFFADVMTSLTKVTNDLTYTLCYFVTGQWKDIHMVSCADRWQMTQVIAPLTYTIPVVRWPCLAIICR
jgi:hypothetical protein